MINGTKSRALTWYSAGRGSGIGRTGRGALHFSNGYSSLYPPATALAGQDGPPALVSTLNDTGYLLQRAGYPRAALQLLAPVVQRAPTRAVVYLNRGDVYLNRGMCIGGLTA